ncbi:GNAT family N-acetyltransferase [Jatrophihabitans fulvus]
MSTPDARLRPLREADDAALVALFADPAVALWNPGPSPADVARWRRENTEVSDDFRTWVITDGGDGLLGLVSLFSIEDEGHTAEVGFRVAPHARGRGLARAALDEALRRASAERGVWVVEAWHAVGNTASCRVLGACGFVLDAVLPANHEYGDGRLHDEHRHLRRL